MKPQQRDFSKNSTAGQAMGLSSSPSSLAGPSPSSTSSVPHNDESPRVQKSRTSPGEKLFPHLSSAADALINPVALMSLIQNKKASTAEVQLPSLTPSPQRV